MAIQTECAICYQITQCFNDGEAYICVNREMCKKNERIVSLQAELTRAEQRAEDKHRAWQAAERGLEAARAVVEAARKIHDRNTSGFRVSTGIIDALAAYDAARRAQIAS